MFVYIFKRLYAITGSVFLMSGDVFFFLWRMKVSFACFKFLQTGFHEAG